MVRKTPRSVFFLQSFLIIFCFLGGILISRESQKKTTHSSFANKVQPHSLVLKDRFSVRTENLLQSSNWNLWSRLRKNPNNPDLYRELILQALNDEHSDTSHLELCFLCYEWGRLSPISALEEIDNFFPGNSVYLKNYVIEGWSKRSPEELATYYLNNKEQLLHTNAVAKIMESWSATSPKEAWTWLQSLEPQEQKEGIKSFLNTIYLKNPENVCFVLNNFHPDLLKDEEITKFLTRCLLETDDSLKNQSLSNIAPEYRNQIEAATNKEKELLSVLSEAEKNPEEALKRSAFLTQDQQEATEREIIHALASSLSEKETIYWLMEHIADEAQRNRIVQNYLPGISKSSDFDNVKNSIDSLPQGSIRDRMIFNYATFQSYYEVSTDYSRTMEMVNSIQDEWVKAGAFSTVIGNWLKERPVEAKLWLSSANLSGLPSPIKQRMEEALQREYPEQKKFIR